MGTVPVAFLADQHIAWLYVPMEETARVGLIEGICDATQDVEDLERLHRPLSEEIAEVATADVRHHQIEKTIHLACVVNRHHVRMPKVGRESRLSEESLAEGVVGSEFRRQDLDGTLVLEVHVESEVHDPHAPTPDDRLDPIWTEVAADERVISHRSSHPFR